MRLLDGISVVADIIVEEDMFITGIWEIDPRKNKYVKWKSDVTFQDYLHANDLDDEDDMDLDESPVKKKPARTTISKKPAGIAIKIVKQCKSKMEPPLTDTQNKVVKATIKDAINKENTKASGFLARSRKCVHSRIYIGVKSKFRAAKIPLSHLSSTVASVLSRVHTVDP